MKVIRRNVFETNSSSSHSLSICNSKTKNEKNSFSLPRIVDDYFDEVSNTYHDSVVLVDFEEFGWGIDYHSDADTKLSYLITMIGEVIGLDCGWWDHSSIESTIIDIYNTEDFKKVENCVIDFLNAHNIKCYGIVINPHSDGYVDHQSVCRIDSFLSNYNCSLEDFIFNPDVTLIIDNDNH